MFLLWISGRHWTARTIFPVALGVICGTIAHLVTREHGTKLFFYNVLTAALTVACVNEYNLARKKRKNAGVKP